MSQAIYRKYRPKGWGEVMGQDHVVQTLQNAIANERVGHAYIFAGPRGTGKTSVARILAKAVNCLAEPPGSRPCNECVNCRAVNESRFLDLIELDGASNNGVDDVRELRDKIGFTPSQGRFRVYIIDEAHMLTREAFNALLKTLEEPPPHAIFVLATTEIDKIPATVLSRCQRHEFRRVPLDQIVSVLQANVKSEGWQADNEALLAIARQSTGSIRDAQSLLDQLASTQSRITLELAQTVLGTATSQTVLAIVDAVCERDSASAMDALRQAMDAGVDPRTLARQVIDYLRAVMMSQMGNDSQLEVTKGIREKIKVHAQALTSRSVVRMMRGFNAAASDSRGGWQPSLGLELAVAESFSERVGAQEAPETVDPRHGPGSPGGAGSRPRANPGAGKAESLRRPSASETSPKGYPATTPPAEQTGEASSAADPTPGAGDGGGGGIGLTDIAAKWRDIRGTLKRTHPAVDGLLNSCKPIEMQGDVLVLGFQSDAVRALMDRPENVEAARRAIEIVLGSPIRIRCAVVNSSGKVPPNIQQDGMVATALNQGGKIVDIQD